MSGRESGEILGEKVKLRPLLESDLDRRAVWSADPEIAELMGVNGFPDDPQTPEQWSAHIQRWYDNRTRIPGVHLLAIEDLSGKIIGDIDLQMVSGSERMAWFSIEIGEKAYWGQGYGTDAVYTLLRYAFRRLRIRQVRLNVRKSNIRAIRCYEKCGFVKEADEGDDYLMVAMAESCDF